jgi:acetyltransferase-like isoleucine patch superfamily enzyme
MYSKDVIIGDNVWIGVNVVIMPGVQIGNNSIIGSSSVVTKNVPSDEIWGGVPARKIK